MNTKTTLFIDKTIQNCERTQQKLKQGTSSYSLSVNRIAALYLAKQLAETGSIDASVSERAEAYKQLVSIRSKSLTGIKNAKIGSATYTRFQNIIEAMDEVLALFDKQEKEQR